MPALPAANWSSALMIDIEVVDSSVVLVAESVLLELVADVPVAVVLDVDSTVLDADASF